jgi:hypothetical protein
MISDIRIAGDIFNGIGLHNSTPILMYNRVRITTPDLLVQETRLPELRPILVSLLLQRRNSGRQIARRPDAIATSLIHLSNIKVSTTIDKIIAYSVIYSYWFWFIGQLGCVDDRLNKSMGFPDCFSRMIYLPPPACGLVTPSVTVQRT